MMKHSRLLHTHSCTVSPMVVATTKLIIHLTQKIAMKKILLGSLALAAIVAVPGVSLAATYAYVNTAGEVMTTESATPNGAIMTAPGISRHSGVMLIQSTTNEIVGDSVGGV